MGSCSLKLAARPEELPRVQAALADLAARERWPPRLLQRVELALEEVILNVMTHGRVGGARRLELTLTPDLDAITIELVDDGPPFDPLQDAPRPDLGAALEDRPVGGARPPPGAHHDGRDGVSIRGRQESPDPGYPQNLMSGRLGGWVDGWMDGCANVGAALCYGANGGGERSMRQ